jgi:hypothetical protein
LNDTNIIVHLALLQKERRSSRIRRHQSIPSIMKENDGRAARNKKKRRFMTVVSIVGTMLVVIIGVKTFSSGDHGGISAAERTSRAAQVLRELHAHGKQAADQAHQALRRRASNGAHNVAHWMQQHAPHGHDGHTVAAGGHGTAGGGGRDERQQGGDDTAAGDDDGQQTGKDDNQGQVGGDFGDDDDPGMQKILQARFMIMGIRPSSRRGRVAFNMHGGYTGLIGSFCHLDWTQPKADATTTPMFHDLVDKSKGCQRPVQYELYDVVQKAREYDKQYPEKIKHLNLTGVVFHESRCGSTLVANALASMNPAKHRVYSESTPPIVILRMSEDDDGGAMLSETQAATILKDVIYLMSRSNDWQEERVFFKFQSIGTRSIRVFQQAFPTTPWMFVYRDPVQVMMSYLSEGTDGRNANCVRPQRHPPEIVERLVEKYSPQQAKKSAGGRGGGARDLAYQDYCAAHVATLTESAVEYMNDYGTP